MTHVERPTSRRSRSGKRHAARALLVSALVTASVATAQEVAGAERWAGVVHVGEDEVALRLRLDAERRTARWTVPHFGWYDLPARVVGDRERFAVELAVYGDRARMELAVEDGVLGGSWRGWGAEGTVRLRLTESASPPFVAEDLRFANDGHELAGTLLLPPGGGPFPAVVWTHGSGRITRADPLYRSLAVWVVEHGVASLIYDKRPPEPGATMQVLAQDAVAAVELLRGHARIEPSLVGVGGLSQGGWIAPIAAAASDRVGFVVGLSAPGISPGEQNIFNQRNKVLNAGFGEEDAREATRLLRGIYGYLRTGDEKERVWDELERSRAHPWFESAYELAIWHREGLPSAPWEHLAALDFDPAPVWSSVSAPVVCVWGAEDSVVPAASRDLVEGWLDASGNARRLLRVLPDAGHDLRLPPRAPWTMGAVPAGANAVPRFLRSLATPAPAPPETRRDEHVDELHGVTLPDPYRWLETPGAERAAWIRAQDAHTTSRLADDPLAEHLRARIVELSQYARAPVPRAAGGLLFTDGQLPGENFSDIRVRSVAERESGTVPRLLVDPHAHPASPGATMALGPPIPSPDGAFVLYGASSASVPGCLRVVEVATGRDLAEEVVPVTYWPWLVSWMADSSGFLYVQGTTVRLHYLGTSTADDPVVFATADQPVPNLAVRASADGSTLFVTAFHPSEPTTRVFAHELGLDTESGAATWRELCAERSGSYQVLGKRGDEVFVYTTLDAPRGRVLAVDVARPAPEHWRSVVPEYPEAVYDDNHPVRPTVGLFADRVAVLYGREGGLLLRVHDLAGSLRHTVQLAELGFNESGLLGHPDEAVVRYDVQSMFDPGTAFELDLHTAESAVIGTAQVPFAPEDFVCYRRSFRADDGTSIPVFLGHRRGLVRDGSHAVLVNNWAALGAVVRPLFLPQYQAWMELGGVMAVPAVRGSGEYGEDWQRAGSGPRKATALDDFGAAARWLVQSGYSRADRVGLMGASMAGAATAGAFIRHADAFGAGLIQIPRIDLLASRMWVEEYGDFTDAEELGAMVQWLPLLNAVPGAYPPLLVQVGELDAVAPPFHGYKLVAAMQAAQRCGDPALLQVVWGAGHSQGTGVPAIAENLSLQYGFLARALGLRP